jgi:hypothetical protein
VAPPSYSVLTTHSYSGSRAVPLRTDIYQVPSIEVQNQPELSPKECIGRYGQAAHATSTIVSIVSGFKIDRMLFKDKERETYVAGLLTAIYVLCIAI